MPDPADRSLGELLTDLSHNVRTLMRQEVALARAELTQSAVNAKRGVIMIGAGAAVAWMGALALAATICLGLYALGLPAWAATAFVGVVLVLMGYLFVRSGIASLAADRVAPRATVESMKDNAQLLRGSMQ